MERGWEGDRDGGEGEREREREGEREGGREREGEREGERGREREREREGWEGDKAVRISPVVTILPCELVDFHPEQTHT